MNQEIIRLFQTPAKLGISISTVHRLIASGKITPTKLSTRAVGFTQAEIDRYLLENNRA